SDQIDQIKIILEESIELIAEIWYDIDAIALTEGPGLIVVLLVGINAAKALAFAKNKPLIPVHHIAGHIYANRIEKEFEFHLLSLIVSGGHTELVYMQDHDTYALVGDTLDDPSRGAVDKMSRSLQLPYLGGPHIDRLAHEGEDVYNFPRAWLEGTYDFSFSGLKSAVINFIHNQKQRGEKIVVENIAASFQASV